MATPQMTGDALASAMAPPVTNRSFARRMENALPYLLLLPSALFLVIFFAVPMVQALILSVRSPEGVWTAQYLERMVRDVNFTDAVRNTFLIILIAVPLQFVFAIAMGLIIQAKLRGSSLFLYFWTIPLAVSDLPSPSQTSRRGWRGSRFLVTGVFSIPCCERRASCPSRTRG
jgi:multiple sugar transport system permease protein